MEKIKLSPTFWGIFLYRCEPKIRAMLIYTLTDLETKIKDESISKETVLLSLCELYNKLNYFRGEAFKANSDENNKAIKKHNRVLKTILKIEKMLDL